MFAGAWCAARLSGNPSKEAGVLQGTTTWGLTSFATVASFLVIAATVTSQTINLIGTAAIASAAINPAAAASAAQQAARAAQSAGGPPATSGDLTALFLTIWGGFLLGLITAMWGGYAGRDLRTNIAARQVPPGETRLAA
jgi:hypothetical protein